jgi:hypothetical protein
MNMQYGDSANHLIEIGDTVKVNKEGITEHGMEGKVMNIIFGGIDGENVYCLAWRTEDEGDADKWYQYRESEVVFVQPVVIIPKRVGKLWTEPEIVKALDNPIWVEKGLVRLYERQTLEERKKSDTIENNAVGFSGFDVKMGTYLAKWVLAGKHLSGKFLEKGKKICIKYRRQLTEIANNKIQEA